MIPSVTVTTAAASRSLVKQATVTGELAAGADTAKVDRLIVAASQAIARHLGREPWLQTYSIKLPGPGGKYMLLPRWPLKANPVVTEGLGDSPTTIDATTYSVAGNARRDRLYREDGWTFTRETKPRAFTASGGPDLVYTVTPTAGWIMPDQITEWSATASVASGAWFSATDDDEPFIFQAGGAGTTGSTEPTWPTAHEGTVTDNDVTWTAYDLRLPQELEELALWLVLSWYEDGLAIAPAGLRSEAFEGMRREYSGMVTGSIPPAIERGLAAFQ